MKSTRKPIRRVSVARSRQMAEYWKLKPMWFQTVRGSYCPVMREIFGILIYVDKHPHHRAGRNGRLLNYVPSWMACSQQGHDWIKVNTETARKHGWICPEGMWDDYEKAQKHYESLTK